MTKHVPLFLPLGSIRLLTIFFSFCIIFVHPALADKMAESPELFDTAFTLQERLDIPDGFVQREMVYISILLGTLVLCLFFFFMQRRMKKLWMMGCAILFGIKRQRNSLNVRPERL